MGEELLQFVREHEALIEAIRKSNASDIRSGSLVIHFDQYGKPRKIQANWDAWFDAKSR